MDQQQQYRVGPKGSVVVGDRTRVVIMPNELLPVGVCTPAQIERLLAARAIFVDGEKPVLAPKENLPKIGVSDKDFDRGMSSEAPVPAGGSTIESQKALEKIRLERIAKAQQEAKEKAARIATNREERPETQEAIDEANARKNETRKQAPSASGPWTFDPDKLVGKPIEELRQLVRDVDAAMEVNHLDEVEVIALLSADFTPAVTG